MGCAGFSGGTRPGIRRSNFTITEAEGNAPLMLTRNLPVPAQSSNACGLVK